MSREELANVLPVLDETPHGRGGRFMLWTATRRDDGAGATWDEFDPPKQVDAPSGFQLWSAHAMRRTWAAPAGEAGVQPHVLSATLGHAAIGPQLLAGCDKPPDDADQRRIDASGAMSQNAESASYDWPNFRGRVTQTIALDAGGGGFGGCRLRLAGRRMSPPDAPTQILEFTPAMRVLIEDAIEAQNGRLARQSRARTK